MTTPTAKAALEERRNAPAFPAERVSDAHLDGTRNTTDPHQGPIEETRSEVGGDPVAFETLKHSHPHGAKQGRERSQEYDTNADHDADPDGRPVHGKRRSEAEASAGEGGPNQVRYKHAESSPENGPEKAEDGGGRQKRPEYFASGGADRLHHRNLFGLLGDHGVHRVGNEKKADEQDEKCEHGHETCDVREDLATRPLTLVADLGQIVEGYNGGVRNQVVANILDCLIHCSPLGVLKREGQESETRPAADLLKRLHCRIEDGVTSTGGTADDEVLADTTDLEDKFTSGGILHGDRVTFSQRDDRVALVASVGKDLHASGRPAGGDSHHIHGLVVEIGDTYEKRAIPPLSNPYRQRKNTLDRHLVDIVDLRQIVHLLFGKRDIGQLNCDVVYVLCCQFALNSTVGERHDGEEADAHDTQGDGKNGEDGAWLASGEISPGFLQQSRHLE